MPVNFCAEHYISKLPAQGDLEFRKNSNFEFLKTILYYSDSSMCSFERVVPLPFFDLRASFIMSNFKTFLMIRAPLSSHVHVRIQKAELTAAVCAVFAQYLVIYTFLKAYMGMYTLCINAMYTFFKVDNRHI